MPLEVVYSESRDPAAACALTGVPRLPSRPCAVPATRRLGVTLKSSEYLGSMVGYPALRPAICCERFAADEASVGRK